MTLRKGFAFKPPLGPSQNFLTTPLQPAHRIAILAAYSSSVPSLAQ